MTSTEIHSVPRANIPAAPLKLKDHPKPLARRMYTVLDAATEEARENYDVIYRYKVGKAHEKEVLAEAAKGSTPEAENFRKASAQYAERIAEYKADYEAEIKEFADRLAERTKLADETLKKYDDALRASVQLESGVTAEENISALENYKAVADMVKGVMTTLAKQGVDIQFSLPSVVSGKKGDGSRGFTPRFSAVSVNGQDLDGTKLMDLVDKIGVKRDNILLALKTKVGGEDNWKAADPGLTVNFVIDDNGKNYDIIVVKAASGRGVKSADGSLTEAPETDDDDDEEDEEEE